MENMPVCLAFDDGYLYPFMIFAYSARLNSKKELMFIILNCGDNLSQHTIDVINKITRELSIDVQYLHSDETFEREWRHVSSVAMQRLLFFDLLQEPFVYLDVDILLEPGWDGILALNEFSPGEIVKAASDDEVSCQNQILHNEHCKCSGIPINEAWETEHYFNSGVLVGNPDLWRMQGLNNRWRQVFFHEFDSLGLKVLDQDLLNYLLMSSASRLDISFNYLTGFQIDGAERIICQTEPQGNRPKVLHFVGNAKPWTWSHQSRIGHFTNIIGSLTSSIHGSTSRDFVKYWMVESLFESWTRSISEGTSFLMVKDSLALKDY